MTVSFLHEGLVELLRKRPEVAGELLRQLLHQEVPAFTEARITDSNFNNVFPAEFRSDLAIVFYDGETPVFSIIGEAQLDRKKDKRFAWPVYATTQRARCECPAIVLVVTPDAGVARWAAVPIALGGDSVFVPVVVGPEGIPVIVDEARAAEVPSLAVLSVLAHGRIPDIERAVAMAVAATKATRGLPEELAVLYFNLIESALSDAARKAFQMLPETQEMFGPTRRRAFAEAEAEAVLEVLDVRGLPVTDEQRRRVRSCTHIDTLKLWLRAAVTAESTDEIFAAE